MPRAISLTIDQQPGGRYVGFVTSHPAIHVEGSSADEVVKALRDEYHEWLHAGAPLVVHGAPTHWSHAPDTDNLDGEYAIFDDTGRVVATAADGALAEQITEAVNSVERLKDLLESALSYIDPHDDLDLINAAHAALET